MKSLRFKTVTGPKWDGTEVAGPKCPASLSKRSLPVFTQVLVKTMENSERLGGQVRPGIEPDTFCLPVLSTEPFSRWWDFVDLVYNEANFTEILMKKNALHR